MTAHAFRSARDFASYEAGVADPLVAAGAGSLKSMSREVALKWNMLGSVLSELESISECTPEQPSAEAMLVTVRAGLLEGTYRAAVAAALDDALDQLEPALSHLAEARVQGQDVRRPALILLERGRAVRNQLAQTIEEKSTEYN